MSNNIDSPGTPFVMALAKVDARGPAELDEAFEMLLSRDLVDKVPAGIVCESCQTEQITQTIDADETFSSVLFLPRSMFGEHISCGSGVEVTTLIA